MPIMAIHVIQDDITHEELLEEFAKHQKIVRYMLNGQIDFENIRARSIQAENIAVGAITAEEIAANSITADKMDVNELSAITANMGTITAGSITTDAHIDVGTDARIGNILYLNESDGTGSKGVVFSTAAGQTASISSQSGDIGIQSGGFITFTIGSSQGAVFNKRVQAPNFNATDGITINNAAVATEGYVNSGLATKANAFSGYSGSIPPGATLFVTNGVITGYT